MQLQRAITIIAAVWFALAGEQHAQAQTQAAATPASAGFIQRSSKSSAFIRAERRDGKELISFNVRQMSLLAVLKPLADLLGNNANVKLLQISADPDGGLPQPAHHRAKSISVGADDLDGAVSDQLRIEDDSARNRLVSARADELTLTDALAVLAKAAHCSIVRQTDIIVITRCE